MSVVEERVAVVEHKRWFDREAVVRPGLWAVVVASLAGAGVAGWGAWTAGEAMLWTLAVVGVAVGLCEYFEIKTGDSGFGAVVQLGLFLAVGLAGVRLVGDVLRHDMTLDPMLFSLLGVAALLSVLVCHWNDVYSDRHLSSATLPAQPAPVPAEDAEHT